MVWLIVVLFLLFVVPSMFLWFMLGLAGIIKFFEGFMPEALAQFIVSCLVIIPFCLIFK